MPWRGVPASHDEQTSKIFSCNFRFENKGCAFHFRGWRGRQTAAAATTAGKGS
jgi:hypothetical protein